MSRYQTVVTATIAKANREIIDGIELVRQQPNYKQEELNYKTLGEGN